jgi:hypothetical protein
VRRADLSVRECVAEEGHLKHKMNADKEKRASGGDFIGGLFFGRHVLEKFPPAAQRLFWM